MAYLLIKINNEVGIIHIDSSPKLITCSAD